MSRRPRILLLTHDRIGPRMAGPAIRCVELARQLQPVAEVCVASLLPLEPGLDLELRTVSFEDDPDKLVELAAASDVLLLQGLMHRRFPEITRLGKKIIADLYDPFLFELLEQLNGRPQEKVSTWRHFWDVQNELMELADYAICASERQRDLWLGHFCALGRLDPIQHVKDPVFRELLGVVPFGVPRQPPSTSRPAMRGVLGDIGATDPILLWGGGIWNWFDPLTPIQAVGRLRSRHPDLRLVFMGTRHPSPEVPEMTMAAEAERVAGELGLRDESVFFNRGWVPYEERQNWLLEADCGISAHFDTVETRFAFRTRVLDYLWAGLPIVTTEGDHFAELVCAHDLGGVASFRSVEDWTELLSNVISAKGTMAETAMRERVRREGLAYTWDKAAMPLVSWVERHGLSSNESGSRVRPVALHRRARRWLKRLLRT